LQSSVEIINRRPEERAVKALTTQIKLKTAQNKKFYDFYDFDVYVILCITGWVVASFGICKYIICGI